MKTNENGAKGSQVVDPLVKFTMPVSEIRLADNVN